MLFLRKKRREDNENLCILSKRVKEILLYSLYQNIPNNNSLKTAKFLFGR